MSEDYQFQFKKPCPNCGNGGYCIRGGGKAINCYSCGYRAEVKKIESDKLITKKWAKSLIGYFYQESETSRCFPTDGDDGIHPIVKMLNEREELLSAARTMFDDLVALGQPVPEEASRIFKK